MVIAALTAAVGLLTAPLDDQALTALIETPSLSSPALSPDGRLVAFRRDQASLSDNRHHLSWWVTPVDGHAAAVKIADGGEALFNEAGVLVSAPPTWSSDSRSIYYRVLTSEGVQVARASLARPPTEVTRSAADILDFVLAADGSVIYATGADRRQIVEAEDAEREQGVLVDHTVDPAQNLFGAIRINGRPAAQRFTGRWFGRRGLLGDQQPRFWRSTAPGEEPIDIETARKAGLVIETGLRPVFGIPGPSDRNRTGDTVAIDKVSGLVTVQRASGGTVVCDAATCGDERVVQLSWRPGRDEIVISARSATGGRVVRLWRPKRMSARRLYATDDLLQGGGPGNAPCSVGERVMVCVQASAITPPRLIALDLDSGGVRDLTASAPDRGVTARRITWADAEGRDAHGYLIEPAGSKGRRPLFITYYSCSGYLRGGTGDEWPLEAFARAGIASLCIEKSTEPPGTQDANLHAYETAYGAIEAVIDDLAATGEIDPRRVGIGGVSFGSDVSMWTAARSERIAAVSIASVQLEPTYWWFNTVRGRNAADAIRQAWGLGAPAETPERWKLLSPALNVDKIRAPVLMQMPEQEFRPTMELYSRLSQTAVPTELYVFPTEPHILTEPRHRLAAYRRNLDWFRFWLLDAEDPDPTKAQQYERWRKARQLWTATKGP